MFGRKKAAERRQAAADFIAEYDAESRANDLAEDVLDLTRDPAIRRVRHRDGHVEYRQIDAD
ncbi:hypothetical protein [Kitasatospora sp. NBC_01302]|uniref:hypothetical protein n=1 Tax=Kitasatospora sp. NBC_01302 TaxID=2903575 RepID=UPI002E12A8DB|nr:hypothetical protein OG294_14245 [Kitasatospora sp. NBC_01302]